MVPVDGMVPVKEIDRGTGWCITEKYGCRYEEYCLQPYLAFRQVRPFPVPDILLRRCLLSRI